MTQFMCAPTPDGRESTFTGLVEQKGAGVEGKKRLRVWIDSQTEEEILRGIREAKDLSEYDNLSASAYLARERRLSDGNQLFTFAYAEIRKQYF